MVGVGVFNVNNFLYGTVHKRCVDMDSSLIFREENPYMSPNQIAVSRIVEQLGTYLLSLFRDIFFRILHLFCNWLRFFTFEKICVTPFLRFIYNERERKRTRKQIFLSLLNVWILNWILSEPTWKRYRFRVRHNINEPLVLNTRSLLVSSNSGLYHLFELFLYTMAVEMLKSCKFPFYIVLMCMFVSL